MKGHEDVSVNRSRNKLRGILSEYKSSAFVKNRQNSKLTILRSELKSHLLECRAAVDSSKYHSYIRWFESQVHTQAPKLTLEKIEYDELRGVIATAPIVSLEDEVHWISGRIRSQEDEINQYLKEKEKLESYIHRGDLKDAIDLLNTMFSRHGMSFFGIQLKIALLNSLEGLEKQKKYSSEVRKVHKNGLLSFITYYASMRNEGGISIEKFNENLNLRLKKHRYYKKDTSTYLKYHISNILPESEAELAGILRTEQSHSLIDLYETFVRVASKVEECGSEKVKNKLLKSIENIKSIRDFRLFKIRDLIAKNDNSGGFELRPAEISDKLFLGNNFGSLKEYSRLVRTGESIDPWMIVYAGLCLSSPTKVKFNTATNIRDIPFLLGSVFCQDDSSSLEYEKLKRFLLNYRFVVAVDGVLKFLEIIFNINTDPEIPLWRVGVHSKYFGVEDCVTGSSLLAFKKSNNIQTNNFTYNAWSEAFENTSSKGIELALPLKILGLIRTSSYDETLVLINGYKSNPKYRAVKSILLLEEILCHISNEDSENTVRLIVSEVCRNQVNELLLPVLGILSDDWIDYRIINDPFFSSIAIYLAWKAESDATVESKLRFYIRQTYRIGPYSLPSELASDENIPKDIREYYLKNICEVSFIDQIKSMKSTNDVLSERQNICSALCSIDAANADKYQDEISEIEYKKQLEEGEWIVDKTRIHVNVDALMRWCNDNLFEEFNRYRELLNVESAAGMEADEILSEIISNNSVDQLFEIDTEADQILVGMISAIVNEFLNNSSFGLDFHLSKRIRHQSFVGLVRGPVENKNLITTKVSEHGEYCSNDYYLKNLGKLDAKSKTALDKAFKRFSKNFDDALIYAKDHKFQVCSNKNSKGLITHQLSHQHLRLIQALAKESMGLNSFVSNLTSIIWASIEPSLSEARKYIDCDLKPKLIKYFEQLNGDVAGQIDRQGEDFLKLSYEIQQSSEEVQHALDRATSWFSRMSSSIDTKKLLTLNAMVKIAVNSSLKCYQSMDPVIDIDVTDSDTMMAASNVVVMHDTIFVALGNVYKHSGLQKPRVKIVSEISESDGLLTIIVTSEVAPCKVKESKERLVDVRSKIENRDFGDQAKGEQRSGFLKIAAVTSQSENGNISFGFNSENIFELKVQYDLKMKSLSNDVGENENITC